MRMEPQRRGRLVDRELGLPLLSRRDHLMGSAIVGSRDDQPVPMHGGVFGQAVGDLRDDLLAPPHAYRRPEIGSVDAIGRRDLVGQEPHRAGSRIERDHPAGICPQLGRDRQRRPRALLRRGLLRGGFAQVEIRRPRRRPRRREAPFRRESRAIFISSLCFVSAPIAGSLTRPRIHWNRPESAADGSVRRSDDVDKKPPAGSRVALVRCRRPAEGDSGNMPPGQQRATPWMASAATALPMEPAAPTAAPPAARRASCATPSSPASPSPMSTATPSMRRSRSATIPACATSR